MDLVVVVARRRPVGRCGEDIEFLEWHHHRVYHHITSCGYTLPHDTMIIPLTTHVRAIKIPQGWAQSAHLVLTEHHVIALEWNDEDIQDEFLMVNEDVDNPIDARASNEVVISDRYLQAKAKVEVAGLGGATWSLR
jgi:hypothetical protein